MSLKLINWQQKVKETFNFKTVFIHCIFLVKHKALGEIWTHATFIARNSNQANTAAQTKWVTKKPKSFKHFLLFAKLCLVWPTGLRNLEHLVFRYWFLIILFYCMLKYFSILHNSQWITLPSQVCLLRYHFCANLLYSFYSFSHQR